MWRVQAFPHLVFEFLPRYRSFQVKLEDTEVNCALIAERGRELTLDVTGRGERHGGRKGVSESIDTIMARDDVPGLRRQRSDKCAGQAFQGASAGSVFAGKRTGGHGK
jgi:hypothetical protein